MKVMLRNIKTYWTQKHNGATYDTDILRTCVESLTDKERELLHHYDPKNDDFIYAVMKVVSRHDDVVAGYTSIDDNLNVHITSKSALTEINVPIETLRNCRKRNIWRICEIDKASDKAISQETMSTLLQCFAEFHKKYLEEESV